MSTRSDAPFDASLVPPGLLAIDLEAIADEFGTPVFVYDEDEIRRRAREYVEHFGEGRVAYASKAFLCSALVRVIDEEGLDLDCSTGGELHVALHAKLPGERIVLHGNNKSDAELATAIDARVGRIVVDSFDELDRIDRLFDQAPELGGKIRSEGIAKQALLAGEAASKRRFRGVYHILGFAPPALIHKLGKMRAEWVPGWLVARLAVEDRHEGRVICQTRVLVRNDVRDEPVFRRTKSQVKERLIAELGGTLRSESAPALAKITRVLRLPAD